MHAGEGARPTGSARGGGAGPRGVSRAARDEKLVPDIYLTIPGSADAPLPEVFTADSLRNMNRVWSGTNEVDTSFFSLKPFLPKNSHLAKLYLRGPKVCLCCVPPFGCSYRKLQVVNRFLVLAVAQSTARLEQSSLSTNWSSPGRLVSGGLESYHMLGVLCPTLYTLNLNRQLWTKLLVEAS